MRIISSVLIFVGLNLIQINAYNFPPSDTEVPSSSDTKVPTFPESVANSASSQTQNASFQESDVINSIQELGRKISYAQRSKKPFDNVVLSPLSITTILNLLMLGTSEFTNLELRKALNYPSDVDENVIHEFFRKMFVSLQQSGSGVQISLNTGLFLQEGFKVLDSYRNVCERSYFADIQNLDFRGASDVATERINRWVASSTKGKIEKLFSRPLNSDTVFVACNVIFLKALWENKFDSRLTRDGIFNTGKGNITIPMMTSDVRVPYVRDDKGDFEMISLPYEGNRYSMYILKPNGNAGVDKLVQLEENLNSAHLDSLIAKMTTQRILVTLPRMKLSQDLDLKQDLKSLGVNRIFSKGLSNFERLSDKKGIHVTDIIHKAVLEVTEEGTSAAAVTTSVISPTSLPGRFSVDQPSLLFIMDNENGLILFWAKVINPEPLIGQNLSFHSTG